MVKNHQEYRAEANHTEDSPMMFNPFARADPANIEMKVEFVERKPQDNHGQIINEVSMGSLGLRCGPRLRYF
jgi:hypothetical protein